MSGARPIGGKGSGYSVPGTGDWRLSERSDESDWSDVSDQSDVDPEPMIQSPDPHSRHAHRSSENRIARL
jgi:hypothetical protein